MMLLIKEKYSIEAYNTNKPTKLEDERVISELINQLKNNPLIKIVLYLNTSDAYKRGTDTQFGKIKQLYIDRIETSIGDVKLTIPIPEIKNVPMKISDIEIAIYCANSQFVLIKPVFGLKDIFYGNNNATITYKVNDWRIKIIAEKNLAIESPMNIESTVTKTIIFDNKGWHEEQNMSIKADLPDSWSVPIKLHVIVHLTEEYAEEYDCLLNVRVSDSIMSSGKNAWILTYVFEM